MVKYTLVRKTRVGRQDLSDEVHLLEGDATLCMKFEQNDVETVRTLSAFSGDGEICDDCRAEIDDEL